MKRNERGFTLMELMVVIVIVAILAAVAVPLYINYVKDAQRTEAKGAIGAVITAEQVNFQKFGHYNTGLTNATIEASLGVDLSDAKGNWTFKVDPLTGATGFIVTATPVATAPTKDLGDVTYTCNHDDATKNVWTP